MARMKRLQADSSACSAWLASGWMHPASDDAVSSQVAQIIEQVAERGDEALLELTARFDGWQPQHADDLMISSDEIAAAAEQLDEQGCRALERASERIADYHARVKPQDLDFTDQLGNRLQRCWRPLDTVAVYVPGGTASYPSSLLMSAVPARAAGVGRIVLVTPAATGGLSPWVAYAAKLAGIESGVRVGGAQAVAALALGTARVEAVAKIVGPGNAYVAEAKRQLVGKVGIDLIAGPSELVIVSDGSTDAAWIAAELAAQAEHGADSKIALLSASVAELDEVEVKLAEIGRASERSDYLAAALSQGALIEVVDLDQARELANRIAPEHLQLAVADPRAAAEQEWICGALFIGSQTSVALGDYCAGSSHILPTGGTAAYASGLSVTDFMRATSMLEASAQGASELGRTAASIADGEGLPAHAQAARFRCKS